MSRPMDDFPYRAIRQFFVSVDKEMVRKIDEHVAEHHLPCPRTDRVTAVPWPDEYIDDAELAKMVEAIEGEDASLDDVAQRFARPKSLVFRELAAYYRRHSKWVREYAWCSG